MDYGRALRTCRAIRGWDQERVAELSSLSKSYVSLIESGQRTPSARAVKKLSAGLGIPESLFVLLATDVSSLYGSEGKTFDQLARSLLQMLVAMDKEKDLRKTASR
jgi:transcriptional regulator with XRE-family HTH domain